MAATPTAAAYDPLLDEVAAAEILDVSPLTLRKWRCVGGGPEYIKVGRLVRYEGSSLTAFKIKRRRASTSQQGA